MKEHVELLKEQGLPVPLKNPDPNNLVDPVQFSQLKRTQISNRNGFLSL